QSQRALEIELRARAPVVGRRLRDRFAGHVHGKPVFALVDDSKAHPGTGDRSAEIDAVHVVVRGDYEPEVSTLIRRAYGSYVGHDPGEHKARLVCAHPLVNFEPVDAQPPLVNQAPAAMSVGNRVQADIAKARLPLADDNWSAV